MDDIWTEIADSRRELADYLSTLDDDSWKTKSLCDKWTVRDVVGHLNMPLVTSKPKIAMAMVRHGLNFDKANDRLSRDIATSKAPPELISSLRDNADSHFTPPGAGPEAPLTDITIHTSDIRRPLGQPHYVPERRAEAVLNFLAHGRATGFTTKKRLAGLRFEATDVEWSDGEGALVRGPAEALILAMSGRAVALDDLEGDGVEILRGRL